jgi:hypothetical protein
VFTVKLTATGAGGTNSTTKTVNITAPTKYTITKITLDSVPFVNNNNNTWDPIILIGGTYTNPDIYFKITDKNNLVIWNMSPSNHYANISQVNLPLLHTLSPVYQSSDLKQDIYIDVWDYDGLIDEYIGYVGFSISSLTTGSKSFPTSVTVSRNGIKITLSLTWQ